MGLKSMLQIVCFWAPGSGSGSVSQRYGSGFFYHQAKIVSKTLIPTVLCLPYDFLSLKIYVNVASESNKIKKQIRKKFFLVKVTDKIAGS
jgi:hypothetical protein